MKKLAILSSFVMSVFIVPPLLSADFQKGLNAYEQEDFQTALQEWEPLAEQGDRDAQYNLGVMYDTGQGVSRDYEAAFKWYTLAAEQGYADAQYNLGVMYDKGQSLLQRYTRGHTR